MKGKGRGSQMVQWYFSCCPVDSDRVGWYEPQGGARLRGCCQYHKHGLEDLKIAGHLLSNQPATWQHLDDSKMKSGEESVENLLLPHSPYFHVRGVFSAECGKCIKGNSSTEDPFQGYFLVRLWSISQDPLIDRISPGSWEQRASFKPRGRMKGDSYAGFFTKITCRITSVQTKFFSHLHLPVCTRQQRKAQSSSERQE